MSTTPELLPLPKPSYPIGNSTALSGYSAAQMREYAAEAVRLSSVKAACLPVGCGVSDQEILDIAKPFHVFDALGKLRYFDELEFARALLRQSASTPSGQPASQEDRIHKEQESQ